LKSYGLDKPEARWKLTAGDQEVLNLVIGGREKGSERRYAQLAGKDIVFLLDPKLSARALAEFRARTVWPMPLDAFQVDSVHYGYAKNPFVLRKTETGAWEVEGKMDLKPNTATVNETLAALAGLKVSHYVVDKGADFKLFGLEPPELVIEITTRTGKRTLHIGRAEGDSKRLYARIPDKDRSDVFVIDEADAAKILRDAAAFTKAPGATNAADSPATDARNCSGPSGIGIPQTVSSQARRRSLQLRRFGYSSLYLWPRARAGCPCWNSPSRSYGGSAGGPASATCGSSAGHAAESYSGFGEQDPYQRL